MMPRLLSAFFGWTALALAVFGLSDRSAAEDFYAGKRLTIIVGLEAGGTVDTLARTFSVYLRKHIPGNPAVVIQNMPGAGGWAATNYLQERAPADGTTILYGPWDPLGQALADQGLRARYENFDYLGGTGDIRVNYAKTDIVPGGIKTPRDIMKADNVLVGALNNTDISGLMPHLTLQVLGVKNKMIVGYRGGNDVFLAMQRGEVQFHSTSISTFRSRNANFIKSGQGIGIAYLVPVDRNGVYERSPHVTDLPAFPDLYKDIHGKMPSGPVWDALNWMTNQIGELTYVGFAPRGTPGEATAVLRKAFEAASNDPEYIQETMSRNGVPFSYIGVTRGEETFKSLAEVSPDVLKTLRATMGGAN
jgi:tripartite-type tricarboxylate transporter receptor subunit TctC